MADMNAVIYARYSSNAQREESIEGQVRDCTAFAERNGYRIIGTYIDRAISGTTDNRPDFQRMIKDGKRGQFQFVIVWKLDRFSRERYDSVRYKTQLKQAGVRVISAMEAIGNGTEAVIMESLLEGMAEYFSNDLKQKVMRGMKINAEKCLYNGGVIPLGYLVDETQHYQLNPETAPFVLKAFQMYDDGKSITEIRDWLNHNHVKNTKGGAMTHNSVRHLLNNRRYIGEYAFGDIVVPDGMPFIVSKELFERVHERMARNSKAPARSKAKETYLLTTKLFCGHCGTAMNGESGKGRNGTIHRYYKCHAVKKKLNDCKKKSVKKDFIEDLVVKETMEMLMDDDTIEAIVSMFMRLQDQENTTLPLLEKQLKEVEKGIQNIVTAIEKGMFSEALMRRMEELEESRDNLTTQIAEEKLEKPKISVEFLTFWLQRFRKMDVTKESQRQALIDIFVNAVFVYDDHVLLTFNFKDGTKKITFDDVKAAANESGSNLNCLGVPLKGLSHLG